MSNIYADEGTTAHALAAMCLTEGKDAHAYVGRVLEGEDYPHAMLAPSSAHRWMRCAGSVALETRVEFKPRKFSMEVTEEMADDVQVYVDNIRKFADGNEMLVENTLVIDALGLDRDGNPQGGTGDVIIVTPDELQVHDLKFGRGVEVFAEENEQLMLYALGAIDLVSLLGDVPENIRLVIHQPRIDRRPKEWPTTLTDLRAFEARVKDRASIARSAAAAGPDHVGDSLFESGDHCRFCKAQATCPALTHDISKSVFDSFDVIGNPNETAEPRQVPHEARALGAALDKVDMIESWCKAVREQAYTELQAGNAPVGRDGQYKLVAGKRGARRWTDAEIAEAQLKKFRLKRDEMYNRKLISPTQASKLLKDQPKRIAKLAGLIEQPDGAPHVAPASDNRPAIETVADKFEVLV